MSVRITRIPEPAASSEEQRVKSARGRPRGSLDTKPRNAPKGLAKKAKALERHSKLGAQAALISSKLQETADLTDSQLLERARTIPEARGGSRSQSRIEYAITPELAERTALAYRLMIRGLTVKQIAEQLDVTEGTAQDYIARVRETLKLDPKALDVGYYMGESLAFFQEIRQMALLHASHGQNSVGVKLNAMRIALEAEERKNSFLQKIGVYSPTVVERIERWMVANTETQISEGPTKSVRVNLAAELARLMVNKSRASDQNTVDG